MSVGGEGQKKWPDSPHLTRPVLLIYHRTPSGSSRVHGPGSGWFWQLKWDYHIIRQAGGHGCDSEHAGVNSLHLHQMGPGLSTTQHHHFPTAVGSRCSLASSRSCRKLAKPPLGPCEKPPCCASELHPHPLLHQQQVVHA